QRLWAAVDARDEEPVLELYEVHVLALSHLEAAQARVVDRRALRPGDVVENRADPRGRAADGDRAVPGPVVREREHALAKVEAEELLIAEGQAEVALATAERRLAKARAQ